MKSFSFQRMVVIGTTGSGKSTLAETISRQFHIPHIELDAVHWEPNWKEAPRDKTRKYIETATRGPAWVTDGNYSFLRDIIWPRAEVLIWLDYPLWTIFWQLTRRTFTRWWRRELLWGTNRENLLIHFKLWSEESLYHWLFKTYWRRKREYPILLAQEEYLHLKVIHLKSPREAKEWLCSAGGGR
jgi:adenylate kinase family enzyme